MGRGRGEGRSDHSTVAVWEWGLLPCRLQPRADDALDELRIIQAGLERGLREVLVGGEDGVRVGFDEINLVGGRDAQVYARVAVNGQQPVDAFAGLHNVFGERGVEAFGELVLQ